MAILEPLANLSALYVALGLTVICSYVIVALFSTAGSAVGWIPWLGSKVEGDLHRIESKLTHALAQAVAGIDASIAWQWHQLSEIASWTVNQIKSNAATVFTLAAVLANPLQIPTFRFLWDRFGKRLDGLLHLAEGVTHSALRPITGELHKVERALFPRLGRLEHAIDSTIPRDVAGLRSRTKTLEGEYSKLYNLIRAQAGKWDLTLFAGAVAIALARLGLSWVRCNNVQRVGRELCAMNPRRLDKLLGLAAFLTIGFSFQEFVDAAEIVAKGVGEAVAALEKPFKLELEPLPPPTL